MKRWMVLGLLVCACGSDSGNNNPPPTGSGNITGTVNGQALTVKDAVFGIMPGTNGFNVVVGDRTGLCGLLNGTTIPGSTTVFGFGVLSFGASGVIPPTTGNYDYFALFAAAQGGPIPGAGKWWDGAFAVATNCNPTGTFATGGTLNISQLGTTTTHLKVTLTNINFPNGSLSGTLEAIYCSALQTQNPPCGGISLLARPPTVE